MEGGGVIIVHYFYFFSIKQEYKTQQSCIIWKYEYSIPWNIFTVVSSMSYESLYCCWWCFSYRNTHKDMATWNFLWILKEFQQDLCRKTYFFKWSLWWWKHTHASEDKVSTALIGCNPYPDSNRFLFPDVKSCILAKLLSLT